MDRIQRGGRTVVGFGVGWSLPSPSSVLHWVLPDHSSDQVNALIRVSDARVQQLTDAFNAFSPRWADPFAKADFFNDYTRFLTRYAVAKKNALDWLVSPDAKYAILSKAFRQNYPPDGAAETKGDWSDLYKRLNAAQQAAGAAPLIDRPPSDLANAQSDSLATAFYKATAPFDVLASAVHDQGIKSPEGENLRFWVELAEWVREHQTGITVGAVGLVAVAGGIYVAPVLKRVYQRRESE